MDEGALEHIRALFEKLKRDWPAESHWFCPKRFDDDLLNYDDPNTPDPEAEAETITVEDKRKLINGGRNRQEIAYYLCLVYGLSAEEGSDWQDFHHKRLTELLTSCDRCVRNYHMGRKTFLKEISEEFDDDLVIELSDRVNKMDFLRIDGGLNRAHNLLIKLPDLQRGPKALVTDPAALTALYEALCCSPYHTLKEKLDFPFNDPFKLVQTKKVLRLGDILPAMTRFLFEPDEYRLRFAKAAWQDFDRTLNKDTFDWAVQDALTDAILSVSQGASLPQVERFWEGLLLVLGKLDKDLITHSVRAMEVQPDIYHLALLHLSQYDSEEVLDLLIQALGVLLLRSPEDFWSAYGAISSTTIAEQVFTNKAFDRLLARSHHHELVDHVGLPSALAWISPFVQSLPPAHQYDVCRSLLHHLLERFQRIDVPGASKLACFRAGLTALLTTLMTFVDNAYKINASTSFIVVNNILGLVAKYKITIVDCANLLPDTEDNKELSRLGMQVVRNSVALCCKSISAEFQALGSRKDIRHELESHSQSIWQAALDGLRRDNIEMARNILIGLTSMVGLDKIKPQSYKDEKGRQLADPLLNSKGRFNKDFDQLTEIVSHIFERLSDFTPVKLRQLCQKPATAYPLFAGLMPPDQATHEAAVEVIKTLTGESGRKDAILKTLQDSLLSFLTALAWATRRISKHETFAGIPYLVKISRDVLDSLCDSQDGLLRMRSSPSTDEQKVMVTWWTTQWEAMANSFKNYEQWALGSNVRFMTDVCRDIMEYSESLFDQYSVLSSVLDEKVSGSISKSDMPELSNASRKNLLKHPLQAMEHLVKWLRLRDPYLLGTLVSLICKILRRLGEFDMEIDAKALIEVEMVGRGHHKMYKVTPQQRAELFSAFEAHQGLEEIEKPAAFPRTKQGTIDNWSKSANGLRHEPSLSARHGESLSSTLSDDIRSLSKSLEQGKTALDQIRSRQQVKKPIKSSSRDPSIMAQNIKESREKAKEEKRQRDAKYLAEVKALRAPLGLVAGEGSGLKGIGVQGKDHVIPIKEQGIMISSEDESDDDETDVKVLINRRTERSKKGTEQEQILRRALNQQQQGPIKKRKILRSAHDMRARLVPNMDSLHLTILRWDIFHEGDEPPGGIKCQEVSDTFKTTVDYYNTFYPLLIAEAWRSLSTAKEESTYKPFEIKVVNRLSVDTFFEVGTTMPIAENRDNNISEGDIVLLSKGQNPMRDRDQVLCLSRVYRVTRKKDAVEISYRISGHASGNSNLLSALSPNLKIRGLKITSLTTIEREYAALKSLEFYDLCDEILNAQPSPILAYTDQILHPIRSIYELNMGQAKAIWSARQNDAFTLVQGPPGSGKTKTIVAMVGALLTEKFMTRGVAIHHPRGAESKPSNDAIVQKKLLICAPSNAAVDELVMRLKAGVMTLKGEYHKINVIRLGRSEAIDINVKDVTLDELVRAKMEGDGKEGKIVVSDREKVHQEALRLKEAVNALRPKLEEARMKGDQELERRLQRDFDSKKRDQARIGAIIDDNKANGNSASRENEIKRRRLQQEIIDSAHVLCATLSGSGHEMFKNLSVEFETVIIDEAAQCIELSALIPLKYGCSKCILVGDPKQLPPTVLSKSAARYGYEQSLFVRMQQNHPKDIHLLDTQYRMHPEISRFPSMQFYDGQLVDGPHLVHLRSKPWHKNQLLGPYRFFDVRGTQVSGTRGHSFINMEEINLALQLYARLKKNYSSFDFKGTIGIITPYKAQLREIRKVFQNRYGEKIFDDIEFNTTDAFQGRESEIIIFSCVRARASGGIGFLDDIRRMNVGLTRAKSSLWVLGDSRSLVQGEFWRRLIEDAKARQRYTEGDIARLLKSPAPLSNVDLGSGSAESSGPSTMDVSRRSSIASIEMTDAPDLVDEERWPPSLKDRSNSAASAALNSKSKALTHSEMAEGEELISNRRSEGLPSCTKCGVRGHNEQYCTQSEKNASETGQPKLRHEAFQIPPKPPKEGHVSSGTSHGGEHGKERALGPQYPNTSQKETFKRKREVSMSEEAAPAIAKLSNDLRTVPTRPLNSKDSDNVDKSIGGLGQHQHPHPTNPGSSQSRRPLMHGGVPPPRKKAPADPLIRSRPTPKRPK